MNYIQRVRTVSRALVHKKTGFTLIELVVVLVMLGLLITIAIPNFRRIPDRERKEFALHLNTLTSYALQRAIEQRKIHKVLFNVAQRKISLEQEIRKTASGEREFKPIKSTYLRSTCTWSDRLIIKNFYIDKEDKTQLVGKLSEVWFFVMPDGITQEVIINIVDKQDRSREFSLEVNPFSGYFSTYDKFKKP